MDLQALLLQMRSEQREDHQTVLTKIDGVDAKIDEIVRTQYNHATRLVVVENTRKAVIWLTGTVIVALIGGAFDFVFVHLPRLLSKH